MPDKTQKTAEQKELGAKQVFTEFLKIEERILELKSQDLKKLSKEVILELTNYCPFLDNLMCACLGTMTPTQEEMENYKKSLTDNGIAKSLTPHELMRDLTVARFDKDMRYFRDYNIFLRCSSIVSIINLILSYAIVSKRMEEIHGSQTEEEKS